MAKNRNETIINDPVEKIDAHTVRLKMRQVIEIEEDEVLTINDLNGRLAELNKAIDNTITSRTASIAKHDASILILTRQRDQLVASIDEAVALGVEEVKRGA